MQGSYFKKILTIPIIKYAVHGTLNKEETGSEFYNNEYSSEDSEYVILNTITTNIDKRTLNIF